MCDFNKMIKFILKYTEKTFDFNDIKMVNLIIAHDHDTQDYLLNEIILGISIYKIINIENLYNLLKYETDNYDEKIIQLILNDSCEYLKLSVNPTSKNIINLKDFLYELKKWKD